MFVNKQTFSTYSLLILLGLVLSCYTQGLNTQNVKASITVEQNRDLPSTYVINGLSTDGSRYFIEPEFPNESYLFTPILQVSYGTAHMFKTDDFKYNQIHIGNKYHYYQTDKNIFMARLTDQGLQMTNFAEISIPDIIFSQQVCTHVAVDPKEIYSISACKDNSDNTVYLVMVSYVSSKPFYVQSLKTSLKEVVQMKLVGSFLYVLDHDETTNTNDKLHVYKVNLGNSSRAKQAMEITGYIDQTPFDANKLDIGSFDIVAFESIQKIFLADKSFGLRTIDLNTEEGVLYNALSNPMSNIINSVAVHTCDSEKSCYLVLASQSSALSYASWGRNANASALDFISVFSVPKNIVINQKLTINQNFLAIMSEANEGNRLHFFTLPTDKFVNPISSIGAVDYKPVSSYQNDFTIVCTNQQDGSCKLFVPNPINHLEEYILRPNFSVKIQPNNIKSSYFNVISAHDRKATVQTVLISKPTQEVRTQAPSAAPEQPIGIPSIAKEFTPTQIPLAAMMGGAHLKDKVSKTAKVGATKDSSSDDDSTSLTTFHGWFIIFLIILAGLAGVTYLTNKSEKAPVVANASANAVEAPSVIESRPIRNFIESTSDVPVESQTQYRLMQEEETLGNTDNDLLKVDTGLENDTHEIDLEATK